MRPWNFPGRAIALAFTTVHSEAGKGRASETLEFCECRGTETAIPTRRKGESWTRVMLGLPEQDPAALGCVIVAAAACFRPLARPSADQQALPGTTGRGVRCVAAVLLPTRSGWHARSRPLSLSGPVAGRDHGAARDDAIAVTSTCSALCVLRDHREYWKAQPMAKRSRRLAAQEGRFGGPGADCSSFDPSGGRGGRGIREH